MVKVTSLITNYISRFPSINKQDLEYVACEFYGVSVYKLSKLTITPFAAKKLTRVFNKLKKLPPQYIFNKCYFYHSSFFVNRSVLVPRFDSEPMLEEIILKKPIGKKILEVGVGSGALIITLATELPHNQFWGVDISKKALRVARKNNKLHKQNVKLVRSNLFAKINDTFDIIIANLPYLTKNEITNNLKAEPKLALDGKGSDGLDIIFRFLQDLTCHLTTTGYCYLECNPHQVTKIKNYLDTQIPSLQVITVNQDLHHLDRYLVIRRTT